MRPPMVSDERFAQLVEAGKSDSLARDVALLSTLDDLSKALLTRTKVRIRSIIAHSWFRHLVFDYAPSFASTLKILPSFVSFTFGLTPHPPQGVEAALQQVVFEATATDVRVKNAISNLSLLMNTRFIENVSVPEGGIPVNIAKYDALRAFPSAACL